MAIAASSYARIPVPIILSCFRRSAKQARRILEALKIDRISYSLYMYLEFF